MQTGFIVRVTSPSLGVNGPKIERYYALGESQASARALVRTALQLAEDQEVEVLALLPPEEIQRLNLKPFQVRRV